MTGHTHHASVILRPQRNGKDNNSIVTHHGKMAPFLNYAKFVFISCDKPRPKQIRLPLSRMFAPKLLRHLFYSTKKKILVTDVNLGMEVELS